MNPFQTLRTLRRKTLRDLWGNRTRTLLVALSVAVGVLGIGMIVATWDILITDVHRRNAEIHPAQIEISVPAGVQLDDLKGLERLPGVAAVQGRAVFGGRYHLPDPRIPLVASRQAGLASGELHTAVWQGIEFIALPDPTAQTVNRITPESGAWPPGRNQLVIERSALPTLGAGVGETLIVDAQGHSLALQIAGIGHQQDDVAASVRGSAVAIVNLDTMRAISGSDTVNIIYLTVQASSRPDIVGESARRTLENAGYTVDRVTLKDPTLIPAENALDSLLTVMAILGVLTLALSSFLVTNTISALVSQQIKQIGVMKAIGADTGLVIRAYSLTILAYGLLGTAIAAPLARRVGYALAGVLAHRINVDLYPDRRSVPALAVMLAVGLGVPFLAGMGPLWQGARITVRQAISDYGLGGGSGNSRLYPFLAHVRGLPRVWALALRNTTRVPSRLALTLTTLGLGGAIFVAVLSVDRSFGQTVDNLITNQYGVDAIIGFSQPQRVSRIVSLLQSDPDVARVEGWYFDNATMTVPNGHEVQVLLKAGPADTQFYRPNLQSGRGLRPGDGNAIVVNRKWADEERVQLGDTVTLNLGDNQTTDWIVVGIDRDLVRQQTGVAVTLDSLNRLVFKERDHAYTIQVRYAHADPATQERVTADLVTRLAQNGVDVYSIQLLSHVRDQATSLYEILVSFLFAMSVLTALVGGIGLSGMMSINVLERSKEIGVMRAIGAGTRDILQIFWGESMVVSLVSFALSVILSGPLSLFMTRAVGQVFIHTPLDLAYAWHGIAIWLLLVLVIGTLASIGPALNAANLSVRASLSYE